MERDLGRESGIGSALLHIANAYDGLGEYDAAVRHIREALSFRLDPLATVLLLSLAGRMLVRRGAYEPAAELLQYIAAQPIFARLSPFERREAEAALQRCYDSLPARGTTATPEYDGTLTIDSALALVSKIL
jgi:tetratricopeptide (TPR) repeat protein